MVPSNAGNSRDALLETPHPPPLEDPEETQARKKKETRKSKRIKLSARALKLVAALSGKRISITKIEFSDKSTQDGGTFADVAAATLHSFWRRKRRVAVKKLRLINDMTEEKLFSALVQELRVLDKLSHPNIVEIIGFVEDMENRIAWLVFPWEENGNLRQFLRSGTWELPERVSLIGDVASGLEYLHTRQPPIRHGDLKSLNILVNSSNRAVITDFGSARMIELGAISAAPIPRSGNETAQLELTVSNGTLTLTGPGCSMRWASPECLMEHPLDLASDIWALGWIAWEAITDCFPFEELELECGVAMRVLEGQLPSIYDHCQLSQIHGLCGIMQSCWKLDPRERPSATDCRKAIGWIPQVIPSTKIGKQSTISSAPLLRKIGQIHSWQCQWKEALRMFEQGVAIARSTKDQANLVDLLLQIGQIHRIWSRYVEAEAAYAEALAISRTIRSDTGRANALQGLGNVRTGQSRYIEAEASYAEALAISKTTGRNMGRANALHGLGGVRRGQSRYIEAEALYTEALTIYKTIGCDMGRGNALQGLGDVRRKQSKHIEAEASYDEALAIFKTTGYDVGRANALQGLGDVRREQSKYIEAEATYEEALTICKTIGSDMGRADALQGLVDVRIKQSKYVEAEVSNAEALAIYKITGSDIGRVRSSLGLAEIRIHQAAYAEAKALVEDVASIAERIDYRWGMVTSHKLLEKILDAEESHNKPLPSILPVSTHAEDSARPASLPETDESSAASP